MKKHTELESLGKKLALREIGRISRSSLVSLVGAMEKYSEMKEEERDYSKCPSTCVFTSLPKERRDKICPLMCDHDVPFKKKKTYINEAHQYRISDILLGHRFSKSQIQQFILYHMLPVDSDGFIQYVNIKQIASYLGYSVRTIKNNNKLFQELGLIAMAHQEKNTFNLFIVDYANYHKLREEGGTGYVKLTKEFMHDLIRVATNVNELRKSLRLYMQNDKDVGFHNKAESVFTMTDIKRYLPKHLHHPKAVKKILAPISNVFSYHYNGALLTFQVKSTYDATCILHEKEQVIQKQALSIASDNQYSFTDKELTDIVQMGIEYGIENLLVVLKQILSDSRIQWDTLFELGGRLRMLLRTNSSQKRAS